MHIILSVFVSYLSLPLALAFSLCGSPLRTLNHQHHLQQSSKSIFVTSLQNYENPDHESPEQRAQRMDMVRQLQKSFYQNENVVNAPQHGSTIIEDLPLWRVQWTELPGFQNVLNVHVPHYTNMFQKIIYSGAKPMYFGHLFLPGGSENIDNPEYSLVENSKASLVGVLMKISDYVQMEDGRLLIIVQALEKIRVVDVKRHHSPYSIATVEIIPDKEVVESFEDGNDETDALEEAVAEAFSVHSYESRAIKIDDCIRDEKGNDVSISPLCSYDSNYYSPSTTRIALELGGLFQVEHTLWLSINKMLRLLQELIDPKKERLVPIPTQILGLLPLEPEKHWPKDFDLEACATKLEIEKLLVGTYKKTQFVRVDNNIGYSKARRAQRLSFAVWALADTVSSFATEKEFSRQNILEVESTEERLKIALSKIDQITFMIRDLLNQKK